MSSSATAGGGRNNGRHHTASPAGVGRNNNLAAAAGNSMITPETNHLIKRWCLFFFGLSDSINEIFLPVDLGNKWRRHRKSIKLIVTKKHMF